MATHHARARRNRGPWLQALLANQAETAGVDLDDLVDFIETTKEVKHALIAVDNPAPARGYALVLPVFQTPEGLELPGTVVARVHVIPSQPAEVYRALFSQILVQARGMRAALGLPYDMRIVVDSSTAAPHVVEAVELHGEPYAVSMGRSVGEELTQVSETISAGEPVVIEGDGAAGAEVEVELDVTLDEGTTTEDVAEAAVEVEKALVEDGIDEEVADEIAEAVVEVADSETAPSEDEAKDEGSFECFDCGRTFKTPQALGSHSRSHQVE